VAIGPVRVEAVNIVRGDQSTLFLHDYYATFIKCLDHDPVQVTHGIQQVPQVPSVQDEFALLVSTVLPNEFDQLPWNSPLGHPGLHMLGRSGFG
jgi:hypothetical protein